MQKISLILIACVICTLFSGCYDNEEIDTLATVMAVGIEKQDKQKLYTFYISDAGSFSSESTGDGAKAKCFVQKADDVETATQQLNKKISKKLDFSHLSSIIFSDEVSKAGMNSDIVFFEKYASVRPQTLLAISSVSPTQYLEKLNPSLEVNPEKYFQKVFTDTEKYVTNLRLCDFTNAYYTNTTCLAPVISADIGRDKIEETDSNISQSAVIWKGKNVATLDNNWFLGLMLSDKSVDYNGAEIERTKKPKFDFKLSKSNLKVSINLKVKTDDGFDKKSAEKDAENFLTESARNMLDAVNVRKAVKRLFLLQKKYEEYNFDELIKNAKFNVKFSVVSERS